GLRRHDGLRRTGARGRRLEAGTERAHFRGRGHSGGHASAPAHRSTKNSPESGPFVSRAKRRDLPDGEKTAPTSRPSLLTSGGPGTRRPQPVPSRFDSYRSPSAMRIIREPSGEGRASYSSPAVLIAGPRFSTTQRPPSVSRARQMSLPPRPPSQFK